MGFENLLNHKCDIYHLERTVVSLGFGLPPTPSFGYMTKLSTLKTVLNIRLKYLLECVIIINLLWCKGLHHKDHYRRLPLSYRNAPKGSY